MWSTQWIFINTTGYPGTLVLGKRIQGTCTSVHVYQGTRPENPGTRVPGYPCTRDTRLGIPFIPKVLGIPGISSLVLPYPGYQKSYSPSVCQQIVFWKPRHLHAVHLARPLGILPSQEASLHSLSQGERGIIRQIETFQY